jgi:hypothetical protein
MSDEILLDEVDILKSPVKELADHSKTSNGK